ncbi:MAG: DUF1499 domain-containing protein [Hyphomonadaceae bacterium]
MAAFRDWCARVAAGLALALPVLFLAAAFGVKFGLFDWDFGFGVLAMRALPALAALALGTALVALALSRIALPRRGFWIALAACAPPVLALAGVAGVYAKAERSAPIHDVSTDVDDPPAFSPAVAAARARLLRANGLDLAHARVPARAAAGDAAGRRVTAVQQAAYPDIAPIALGAPAAQAFAASQAAARRLHWAIDRVEPRALSFEARAEDFWFGNTADIAVRVTPADPGAVVDVRSASRFGVGDLGANADRVRAFARELTRELDATP